jgi:hypothetical protein
MEQDKKYKDKKRTRDEAEIVASAKGRKLEMWADKDGKWDMQVAMELILQDLDLVKAPVGARGKKMTAPERDEWVHARFDSDAFDEVAKDDLRDRIFEGDCGEEGGEEGGEAGSEGPKAIRRGRWQCCEAQEEAVEDGRFRVGAEWGFKLI